MSTSLEDMTVDQLLAHAKSLQQSASLLQTLTANPKTRETIQRALKTLNPNLSIPEIDARDALSADIKTERDARIALENRIREEEIRRRLTDQRKAIMEKHQLSEADVLEVEKLMTREVDAIPTYEGAALVYKASKLSAMPTPATFTPPTFELPDKDTWAGGMMSNAPGGGGTKARLDRIGMNEAYKAMNELFGGKVPGLGSAKAN
jgi:hypothetical protein